MTLLPDPPEGDDEVAVELWLAVFDRWLAAMSLRLQRDELDAARRWAHERMAAAS